VQAGKPIIVQSSAGRVCSKVTKDVEKVAGKLLSEFCAVNAHSVDAGIRQ
jgi:hypothetical protein